MDAARQSRNRMEEGNCSGSGAGVSPAAPGVSPALPNPGAAPGCARLVASAAASNWEAWLPKSGSQASTHRGDNCYFLGFQIGLFSILSSHKGTVFAALTAPLFVLALPILDTTLAIVRRGLRGLPIFRPDRKHIHHHLLGMGMSRQKVVLYLYAVTLLFLVMGFAAYWSRGRLIPVLLGAATLILLLCAGKLRFSRDWFAVGQVVGNQAKGRSAPGSRMSESSKLSASCWRKDGLKESASRAVRLQVRFDSIQNSSGSSAKPNAEKLTC